MTLSRFILFALGSLFCAVTAPAQFEIDGGVENLLDSRRAGASAAVSAGAVTAITVWSGGGGYTAPPAVVLAAPPSGTTATATATVSGGRVTAINITLGGGGSGYTTPPAIFIAPPKTPTGSPTTTPQFAGVANTSATAGAIDSRSVPPSFITAANVNVAGTIGTTPGTRYPSATDDTIPASPKVTIVLSDASFGFSFASGVPLYFMGDEIQRPVIRWDGNIASQSYWRAEPVKAGENFANGYLTNLNGATQPLQPQGTVTVTASATGSSTVTVSSVPSGLAAGATLLGQRINLISGTTITLAGNASQAISTPTAVSFSTYQPYYFSPHANKVFASQPGRVTITWVSASPDTSAPSETVATYKFRRETFAVSSASRAPARTIFWTEKSFKGPLVQIPQGRIERANPVYNSTVPGMTTEYVPVGSNPSAFGSAEQRTIWFDNEFGLAALHAYNAEGRIFVEYLGAVSQNTSGNHQFLGADVVDIKRVAEVSTIETKLGEPLRPRQEAAQNGDDQLIAKVASSNLGGKSLTDDNPRPDGNSTYVAVRENLDPEKVSLYWLETSDAAIHFLTAPAAPGLSINWPKYKRNYRQVWPEALSEYAPVTVENAGNRVANGPKFEPESLPELKFQDDPEEAETKVDARSQRILVDLTRSGDKTNRTLLKFSATDGSLASWYVRLYIQSQDKLGSPAVAEVLDPDGSGPLKGSPAKAAVYTLNDLDADGIADWSPTSPGTPTGGRTTATVGQRLEPPSPAFEPGGYIAAGRGYSAAAYIDPFTAGAEAAARGGIIPVNALSTDRSLTVWWLKKITAPSSKFSSFYVPGIAARYTVSFPSATYTATTATPHNLAAGDAVEVPQVVFTPANVPPGFYTVSSVTDSTTVVIRPQELVIASGKGVENPGLTSEQAAGSIYVQNDPALIGYNPNEEHALMLQGNAYALRDDLNITDLNITTSSEPFVLIQYTEAATNRPAMRLVKVLRTNATYPLVYNKIAGTPAQPPMPLTALPLPLKADLTVRNTEVATAPDTAAGPGAPAAYNKFTFEDRKGQHWIYRGPHNGGTPSFGMRFYYYLQAGFHFPALTLSTQPAIGSIQPYIADTGAGEAVTLSYLPKWPDDPTLPVPDQKVLGVLRTAETLMLAKAGLPQVRGQSSAQVLYQQSIANTGSSKPAVALHDPTRAKSIRLDAAAVQLAGVPASIQTTSYAGRIFFQSLPPDLQNRFYFDANAGPKGSLVLTGEFVNVPVGEDYLNLNQVSAGHVTVLKALCPSTDTANKNKWNAAIDGLSTKLETFRESATVPGTWVPDATLDRTIAVSQRADITDPDTAVDSYALSSTGSGTGYITLVFNNGKNPAQTDPGNPVDLQIIKVSPDLYPGDIKVLLASNPLDEQVVLRHSGDYGGQPENFEFQWRYGFPVGGLNPPVNGFTATATASLGLSAASFTIASGTTEYSTAPTVTISGGGGSGATASPVLTANRVTGITILTPGTGYTSAPTITFSGGTISTAGTAPTGTGNATKFIVSSVILANGGSLYAAVPDVVISNGGGSGATALANLSSGSVASVTVTAGGANYTAPPTVTFPAPPPRVDLAATFGDWFKPDGTLVNTVLVGGSPTAVIKTPAVLMGDTWFTMTYRKVVADQAAGVGWSDWTPPVQVEGWVKRVLARITPFNQRMDNLYNTSVNTDVSLLTQAGQRWEGNIALNLENINDAGLIEIYETVLNRAKSFTTESGIDLNSSNQALILAAGYLSDLYTILGNEAYADAANPTISVDDQNTVTEVNTSRFSFEGQVTSSLDEELALLRGRDDFGLPSIGLAPAYNRLFWNYTRGINSGEVLYAVNYNIKEKSGATADGRVDAVDALRMFPQGHGDAYGHYLTALTGYYKLLTHPFFTWNPSAEAVTVLGQSVLVDYKDERKFAAAAGNVARTAQQVFALVQRQSYQDDPAAGWGHFQDGKVNPRTAVTRHQGLDETASRSAQGSFYHWITGNALLPDVDTNPSHTGVQIVDRTTVPELDELVAAANIFQSGMDLANAHLNPLGLSPGAIAFDISPAEHKAGNSHYEQVNARALRAVLNAKGAFDQAAKMTRLLRNQENQITERQDAILDQERAAIDALEEIYGTPYAGDIGPGKPYAQGYSGPDLLRWSIIERPTDFVDTSKPVTVTLQVPVGVKSFSDSNLSKIVKDHFGGIGAVGLAEDGLIGLTELLGAPVINLHPTNRVARAGLLEIVDLLGLNPTAPIEEQFQQYFDYFTQKKTFTVSPNQFVQFSSVVDPTGGLGSRAKSGELQKALLEAQLAQVAMQAANWRLQELNATLSRQGEVFEGLVLSHLNHLDAKANAIIATEVLKQTIAVLNAVSAKLKDTKELVEDIADTVDEAIPDVVGFATDVAAPAETAIEAAETTAKVGLSWGQRAIELTAAVLGITVESIPDQLEKYLSILNFNQEELQATFEMEKTYREVASQHFEFVQLAAAWQAATQNIRNLIYEGQKVLADRETFRQRAAAVITGYRTKDLTFRTFRNEALEQYRTLFDLASRYSYLAAKSYDYETGLLGTREGQAVINKIVASRALGDLTGGVPQATVSTLGDAGLAGTMAQLNADFSVAEGRLGINNPDQYGTLFSLRAELFRILSDDRITSDDDAWKQTLEQSISPNLLADADVAKYCNNLRKPDGTPVAGIIIPFSTTIQHGKNFFGLPGASGDHAYTPTSYSTKISSAGIVLKGYVGMDPYAIGTPGAGGPASNAPNALMATPYVYLIPVGMDSMLAPPLGDTNTVRSWTVHDQALPLPYNLGATSFNTTQFFTANGTLSSQPWILRKHQAFRPVNDPAFFYSNIPLEFTNSRLIGRSVWNSQWKIVIPANTLLNNEQEGLNRFVASVKDIQLFLRTYSHSGN